MKNKKIKINLDLDDVLNRLCEKWLETHYEITGERLKNIDWDMAKVSKFGDLIYSYFGQPQFWYNIPVNFGAKDVIEYLESKLNTFDYTILSKSNTSDKEKKEIVYLEKYHWLKDNFSPDVARKFILCNDSKGNYSADVIIDDYINNLVDSPNCSVKILFRAEHNKRYSKKDIYDQHFIKVHIINDMTELLEFLKELHDLGLEGVIKKYKLDVTDDIN